MLKRQRDKEEDKNSDVKTQREENVEKTNHNLFSAVTRDTARQSFPGVEMSAEPSTTPEIGRSIPLQDPLVSFDPPPEKLQNRDGRNCKSSRCPVLTGKRTTVDTHVTHPFDPPPEKLQNRDGRNCKSSRCPVLTAKRPTVDTHVTHPLEVSTTTFPGNTSSSKTTNNNILIDPGHLQVLTSVYHIPTCPQTKSTVITILDKDTWTLQVPRLQIQVSENSFLDSITQV